MISLITACFGNDEPTVGKKKEMNSSYFDTKKFHLLAILKKKKFQALL